MSKRPIQAGDFFLLPFTGTRRSRLVKAVQPHPVGGGQWYASNEAGHTSVTLLTSCQRCSPSLAKCITKEPK
jgi:hypothetical protein